MAPTVYLIYPSPPCRAVLITAKAIGLNLAEKEIKLLEGEHLQPPYLKLNPQHTVPTLVDDDGFTLWDSHAIMVYLVTKYAKDDALYPKDLKKRALIDQRLHFDSGVVFAQLRRIVRPILHGEKNCIDQKDKDDVFEAYGFLEAFLDGKKWVAGDAVSIADYSLITSVNSLNALIPVDPKKYPRVGAWFKRCQELPEYEANRVGLEGFTTYFENKLAHL